MDIPPNRVIGHKCDWNACCNPVHLECVTQRKNSQDMADRELHPYEESVRYKATRKLWSATSPALSSGEGNLNAKLDTTLISEIRRRYAAGGVRQVDLAKEFGVAQSHISRIVRAASWSHVTS
ncbi:HNH endonuclease [Streptomyces sp. NBC_01239]|uniref:HNH endonuclease n=1 Tax=Streptomyces sp. NBC_01239 TaxID=2903792 RepID=UPI00338EF4F3